MKLNRVNYFVSKERAIKHIEYLAKSLKIDVPKYKDFSQDVILETTKKNFRLNFAEEVDTVIKTGKGNMLQTWFDANDRFLQPALEMHMDKQDKKISGLGFKLRSSLGSHIAEVSSDGIIEAPELSLARDICYYHEQTCTLFNDGDITGFSRSFRGFLHSCVALVDCFLFRYTFHIKDMIGETSQYVNTLKLDSRIRMEERLEAWLQTFAPSALEHFEGWKERIHFMELKRKRNEITHPTVPTVIFEPGKVAQFLNYGASGVGGMLAKMRRESSTTDRIGFIHQITHLPKVSKLKTKR